MQQTFKPLSVFIYQIYVFSTSNISLRLRKSEVILRSTKKLDGMSIVCPAVQFYLSIINF